MNTPALTVLIPAHDEAARIDACLAALWEGATVPGGAQAIVIANGCRDDTASRARAHAARARAAGWTLEVIETAQPGKLNALNLGEAVARPGTRAYLDADVIVDSSLMAALAQALTCDAPRYASGRPRVAQASHRVTRAYARFWTGLPFFTARAPGFGVYAVNAAGRRRWSAFPPIISDDTFVRLHFAARERIEVAPGYVWPMVEGVRNLVRVRRRQDRGVHEIAQDYPELTAHDDTPRLSFGGLASRALRDPLGFAAYGLISLAVRSPLFKGEGWVRGR